MMRFRSLITGVVVTTDRTLRYPYEPLAATQTGRISPEVEEESINTNWAVTSGSVAQILEWVGDDPARAAAALRTEKGNRARVTLIRALERLV